METNHEKILMMKNDTGNNWEQLLLNVNKITNSAKSYNINKVVQALENFIPEYSSSYKDEDSEWIEKTSKKII
jgi:hypothetical protein